MASATAQPGTSAPYRSRPPERTPLYQVVQEWLATYLELAREEDWDGEAVAADVEREFRRFLECAILACGLARAYCHACGHDFLLAFSGKGCGVCPSCRARRMAETAAHLVEHVFPSLPVRQGVIAFPKRLGDFLQREAALRSAALRVIEQALKEQSPRASPPAKIGAVAFIHHFGASLNEHTHVHICLIEGVFEGAEDDSPIAFFEATAMDARTLAAIQCPIRRRLLRLFVRRALLEADEARNMGPWQHEGGFSVDACVRIEGHDRQGLERLLGYGARPPFALERIERIEEEKILYHLPKPTPDGRTRLRLG
jgi:Putative transposase/Transposase zinc-binding domain